MARPKGRNGVERCCQWHTESPGTAVGGFNLAHNARQCVFKQHSEDMSTRVTCHQLQHPVSCRAVFLSLAPSPVSEICAFSVFPLAFLYSISACMVPEINTSSAGQNGFTPSTDPQQILPGNASGWILATAAEL